MDMLSPLAELDAVNELLEVHISELHAQLQSPRNKGTAKTPPVRTKRPRTPAKTEAAPQPKTHRKQKPANILTGRWNKHEHDLFLRGLEMYGKEWKKMAGLIPSRTVVQIRTHAQKYFQKIKKRKARGKSIDSVTNIEKVRPPTAAAKKKKKRVIVPNKSELPVLIPIETNKKVKPKCSNSKRASADTKKAKVQVKVEPANENLKEQCRDGSPMSHFDLTFHFPYQSAPESATNLFPAIFSDLDFDNMMHVEPEIRSLEDIVPDRTGWPAQSELISLEDWNGENDDFFLNSSN